MYHHDGFQAPFGPFHALCVVLPGQRELSLPLIMIMLTIIVLLGMIGYTPVGSVTAIIAAGAAAKAIQRTS